MNDLKERKKKKKNTIQTISFIITSTAGEIRKENVPKWIGGGNIADLWLLILPF